MNRLEQLLQLTSLLISDMPQYKQQAKACSKDEHNQWLLFRSLVNVREPKPVSKEYLRLQDTFLQNEIQQKGITDFSELTPIQDRIYIWRGDITTLRVDAIVNAANSGMTGCYCPLHGCIDNAIHTFAGVQLRLECASLMKQQGFSEPTGQAKITKAYNLPCNYVLHTVGPVVANKPTSKDCELLASCYQSCLSLAYKNKIKTLAFCCISTGEFHFPNKTAARIAVETVKSYLSLHKDISVVFNVFKGKDFEIYNQLLQ